MPLGYNNDRKLKRRQQAAQSAIGMMSSGAQNGAVPGMKTAGTQNQMGAQMSHGAHRPQSGYQAQAGQGGVYAQNGGRHQAAPVASGPHLGQRGQYAGPTAGFGGGAGGAVQSSGQVPQYGWSPPAGGGALPTTSVSVVPGALAGVGGANSAGGGGPNAPTEELVEDWIRQLIEQGLGGPSQEEYDRIQQRYEEDLGQGLVDARARMGGLGMGASGAMMGLEGDLRRQAAGAALDERYDLQTATSTARWARLARTRASAWRATGRRGLTRRVISLGWTLMTAASPPRIRPSARARTARRATPIRRSSTRPASPGCRSRTRTVSG